MYTTLLHLLVAGILKYLSTLKVVLKNCIISIVGCGIHLIINQTLLAINTPALGHYYFNDSCLKRSSFTH